MTFRGCADVPQRPGQSPPVPGKPAVPASATLLPAVARALQPSSGRAVCSYWMRSLFYGGGTRACCAGCGSCWRTRGCASGSQAARTRGWVWLPLQAAVWRLECAFVSATRACGYHVSQALGCYECAAPRHGDSAFDRRYPSHSPSPLSYPGCYHSDLHPACCVSPPRSSPSPLNHLIPL